MASKVAGRPTAGESKSVLNAADLAFYKQGFRKLLIALLIALAVILALVAALIYVSQVAAQGSREYFAVDTKTGRMTPMPPLGQPYIADGALLTWATDCVTRANTYNFVEFRRQFQDVQACFTDEGWEQFVAALNRAGSVPMAREGRLIVSSNAAGAAVINNKGLRRGTYTWEIQIPIVVTFQGGQSGRNVVTSNQIVTLMVERVPTFKADNGVGVASYVAQER